MYPLLIVKVPLALKNLVCSTLLYCSRDEYFSKNLNLFHDKLLYHYNFSGKPNRKYPLKVEKLLFFWRHLKFPTIHWIFSFDVSSNPIYQNQIFVKTSAEWKLNKTSFLLLSHLYLNVNYYVFPVLKLYNN